MPSFTPQPSLFSHHPSSPLPGYNLTSSIFVASRYLSTTHLWDAIRVQGGAYGASAQFDLNSGVWMYCSWRDPKLLDTVDAFDSEPGRRQTGSVFLRCAVVWCAGLCLAVLIAPQRTKPGCVVVGRRVATPLCCMCWALAGPAH